MSTLTDIRPKADKAEYAVDVASGSAVENGDPSAALANTVAEQEAEEAVVWSLQQEAAGPLPFPSFCSTSKPICWGVANQYRKPRSEEAARDERRA